MGDEKNSVAALNSCASDDKVDDDGAPTPNKAEPSTSIPKEKSTGDSKGEKDTKATKEDEGGADASPITTKNTDESSKEKELTPPPNDRFRPKRPRRQNSSHSSQSNDDSKSFSSKQSSDKQLISPEDFHKKFCLPLKRRNSKEEHRAMQLILKQGIEMGESMDSATTTSNNNSGSSNNPTPTTLKSSMKQQKPYTPSSNTSNRSTKSLSRKSDASKGSGSNFPSMPFSDASTASRDNTTSKNVEERTMLERMKQEILHQSTNNDGGQQGGQHRQMVTTGVPLRESGITGIAGMIAMHNNQHRRRSSNWDTLSLSSFPVGPMSPDPFKDVITKDNFFSKMPGLTPNLEKAIFDSRRASMDMSTMGGGGDHQGMMIGNMRDQMNVMSHNAEMRERMMMNMMAERGMNGQGGMGGGGGNQHSMLGKRKYSMDQMMGMMGNASSRGGSGPMDGAPLSPKSPGPKKSFLARERIMDQEMRNHMMDALSGFPRRGGGGGGVHDINHPPSHPNSSFSQHMTPMDSHDGMLMSQANAMQQARMMAGNVVGIPSLTSPNDNSMFTPGLSATMSNVDAVMEKEDKEKSSSSKKKSKKSGGGKEASKKSKSKDDDEDPKKKKGEKMSAKELAASVLAATGVEKPKRPFSAYNLFFQLEREFIKHELSKGRQPSEDPMIKEALERVSNDDKAASPDDTNQSADCGVEKEEFAAILMKNQLSDSKYYNDPHIPHRYSHMQLDKYWYSVGHKQKRKHRKTEGSVGFIELTKMVSARWKHIDRTDPHVKDYCQKLADIELNTYKEEMEDYKKAVKEADLKAKNDDFDDISPIVVKKSSSKSKETTKSKASASSKKKQTKKGKGKDKGDDRPSTPPDDNTQQSDFSRARYGSVGDISILGGDMARFTDLARMSGPFLNTPGGESFMAGMCGETASSADVGGLPPPPFGDGGRRNNAGPQSSQEARMAVAQRMIDARRSAALGGGGGGLVNDQSRRLADDIMSDRSLVEERARLAIQMGDTRLAEQLLKSYQRKEDNNRMMGGNDDIQQKFAKLAEAEARHRMQMEMQGGRGSMPGSDNRFGQQQGRVGYDSMMAQQGNFQSGTGGIQPEDQFDAEVDRFLSTLKTEIKENRRKQLMGSGGDGSSQGFGSMGGNFGAGSSNFSTEEMMARMSRRMSGIGSGNSSAGDNRFQEEMIMRNSRGGGSDNRAEMMAQMQMMMMQQNRGGGSGGSRLPDNSANQISPELLAEMMRRERERLAASGADGVSPNNSMDTMMPRPPFSVNDFIRQQQQGGGAENDDNPTIPEYGWSRNNGR